VEDLGQERELGRHVEGAVVADAVARRQRPERIVVCEGSVSGAALTQRSNTAPRAARASIAGVRTSFPP
jgi:hypothetical protein